MRLPEYDVKKNKLRSLMSGEVRDWSYDYYKIKQIHEMGYTGEGVKVCVLDTGVDFYHDDIKRKIHNVESAFVDHGMDNVGHGSFCVGRYIAEHNGIGTRGWLPDCELTSIKILDANSGDLDYLVYGLELVLQYKPHIVNLSIGFPEEYAPVKRLINEGIKKGIIYVAASGNEYQKKFGLDYPSAMPAVFAVGSHNKRGGIDDFTDVGRWMDVYCSGSDVVSTGLNNTISWMSGTSMATPSFGALLGLMKFEFDRKGLKLNHSNILKFVNHL